MPRPPIADLAAFLAVARERSFTRAAAQLGVSSSALSQTIRSLEARLGTRLLGRTTRSLAPTSAGERLIAAVGPQVEEIEAELAALGTLSDEPSGRLRINTVEHAAETVLWPALPSFAARFPKVHVEIVVENSLTDIVAGRFDASIRLGGRVARDMVTVRLGPGMEMAAVATPAYFAGRGKPIVPQDLVTHSCINLRLPTLGDLYSWEFEQHGREVNIRVDGRSPQIARRCC